MNWAKTNTNILKNHELSEKKYKHPKKSYELSENKYKYPKNHECGENKYKYPKKLLKYFLSTFPNSKCHISFKKLFVVKT